VKQLFRNRILFLALLLVAGQGSLAADADRSRYTFIENPHPDATGKVYMGREISHVMGHEGAGWLERPEREKEEMPRLLMELLELKPGMVVADIGAGSGYHTRRMAKAVAPDGKVMAVDIQPEMLQILTNKLSGEGITNVVPVLGEIDDPKLPESSVDVVLMVDVYHEFSHPFEMMEGITRSLKPGGRVVFVEYRGEDKWVPIKEHHKMTAAQVRKEMGVHPLKWTRTVSDRFPWQHLIVFEKAAGGSD
jgi:ubiquinone/menaquinone biosynthesis C-methylase UbiE